MKGTSSRGVWQANMGAYEPHYTPDKDKVPFDLPWSEDLLQLVRSALQANSNQSKHVYFALLKLHRNGYDICDPDTMRTAQIIADLESKDESRRRAERDDEIASSPKPHDDGAVVYYMRIRDLVKIGTTVRLKERFQSLQADEVLAAEPGSYDLERARHNQFRDSRYRGERFYPTPDLLEHIAEIKKLYPR